MSQAVNAEFKRQNNEEIELELFTSSETMQNRHAENPFDVIFLDIDMPEVDGFHLASKIAEGGSCYIIFVTGHPELVYDSLYFRPLNFITKSSGPDFTDKLHNVVNQLFNEMKQNKIIILENKDVGRTSLLIKNVLYIESCKHYVTYHSENKPPITVRGNIGELDKSYSKYDFVRIHKSFLVNLRYIFNIDKNRDEIILKQGTKLSMSKNYKRAVDMRLTQYLRTLK